MPRRDVVPAIEIAKALVKLGKASFGDILKEADISRQALDTHLKIMVSQNLILSEQDPKDKRKYLYWLNPNELCIITVNEAIETIENELKAIGEELTADERKALEHALKEYARPILVSWLREGILKNEKPNEVIYNIISTAKGLKDIIKTFKSLSKLSNIASLMKDKANSVFADQFLTENVKLYIDLAENLPDSFIEKWIKTKAYKSSPISQMVTAFNLLTKLIKL